MQAKRQPRPLERTTPDSAIRAEPLISVNSELAAHLLRLGIIPDAPKQAQIAREGISVDHLRTHIQHYLEDISLQDKPNTLTAKG